MLMLAALVYFSQGWSLAVLTSAFLPLFIILTIQQANYLILLSIVGVNSALDHSLFEPLSLFALKIRSQIAVQESNPYYIRKSPREQLCRSYLSPPV